MNHAYFSVDLSGKTRQFLRHVVNLLVPLPCVTEYLIGENYRTHNSNIYLKNI